MTATSTGTPPTIEALQPPAPKRMKGKVAAGLMTIGLLVGGGLGLTQLGGSTSASTATGAAAQGFGGGPGGPGGAGGRGAPASGTISSVSGTSISVKSSTGTVRTFTISSGTTIQNNGAGATATSLAVGEQVVVFSGSAPGSTTTAASDTANRIMAGTSTTKRPGGPPAGTAPGSTTTGSTTTGFAT